MYTKLDEIEECTTKFYDEDQSQTPSFPGCLDSLATKVFVGLSPQMMQISPL